MATTLRVHRMEAVEADAASAYRLECNPRAGRAVWETETWSRPFSAADQAGTEVPAPHSGLESRPNSQEQSPGPTFRTEVPATFRTEDLAPGWQRRTQDTTLLQFAVIWAPHA
jgi:hypothetical protein